MAPEYTAFANALAKDIRHLPSSVLNELSDVLQRSRTTG
jgi:hypothetical protein